MNRPTGSPLREFLVALLLVVTAVALLQLDRRRGGPGPVGQTVSRGLAPLQHVITEGARGLRGMWLDYVALTEVRATNRHLQASIRTLRAQAAEAEGLATENARLRRLLQLADRRKDLRLRAARVVSRGTSPYFRVVRITLDVGADGAEVGMPVVAPGGVVGQLHSVVGERAEVLLVVDPRSAIDVVLEKSRARGVAVGTGEPDRYAARLEYLERAADTDVGERVMTTGDDGRYPRGLVVGEVMELRRKEHGLFQEALVRPLVDLSALDEVFVVLGASGLSEDGQSLTKIDHDQRHP